MWWSFLGAFAGSCTLEGPTGDGFATLHVHDRWACGHTGEGAVRCMDVRSCTPFEVPGTVRQLIVEPVPCGVRTDGSLACVDPIAEGRQVYQGYERAPEGRFVRIAGARDHACAERTSGELACWGRRHELLGTAPPDPGWDRLFASDDTGMCAVKSDRTLCWPGRVDVDVAWVDAEPDGRPCGVRADGELDCPMSEGPASSGPQRYRSVVGACAVAVDGGLHCSGDGAIDVPDEPMQDVAHVLGDLYCGLTPDGRVRCWGRYARPPRVSEEDGRRLDAAGIPDVWKRHPRPQLGLLGVLPPLAPPLEVKSYAGCARTTDLKKVVCWTKDAGIEVLEGRGPYGPPTWAHGVCAIDRRGRPHCSRVEPPDVVMQPELASGIAGVGFCGLARDGRPVCWAERHRKVELPTDVRYRQLVSDRNGVCALDVAGRVHCDGSAVGGSPPPPGPHEGLVLSGLFGCSLSGNDLTCWGVDTVRYAARTGVDRVFESEHLTVRTVDGRVWVWNGTLHHLPRHERWRPLDFAGPVDRYVSAAWSPGCALLLDGRLQCGERAPMEGRFVDLDADEKAIWALREDGRVVGIVGGRNVEVDLGPARAVGAGRGAACVLRPGGGQVVCTGERVGVR